MGKQRQTDRDTKLCEKGPKTHKFGEDWERLLCEKTDFYKDLSEKKLPVQER